MNGFVLIDKPKDITSFIAVAKCRRIFETKKCGHTGTLDPLATGVLVVAIGNSTRFIELIPSHNKAYEATFELGKRTDTLDITGEVLETAQVNCTREDVKQALSEFVGKISQLPPMYSAIKKDGQRLYDLARQGIEVEREAREVEIFSAELFEGDEENNTYKIRVECSNGTYIRTLIDDLGKRLGTFGVMTELNRIMANGVKLENCHSFEQLEKMKEEGRLQEAVIPVDELLDYPKITVSAPQAKRFSNGGELDLIRVRQIKHSGYYRIYTPEKEFCGIGEADLESGILKVKRVYVK